MDLSSFVEKDGEVSERDSDKVEQFLNTPNAMERLVIKKNTSWEGFDELVKKIQEGVKQGQNGRQLIVDVSMKGSDEVCVYQV